MAKMSELQSDWSFDDVMMANEILDNIERAEAKAQRARDV